MRLREVILRNVFQHETLCWRPVVGLNGVLGANGSGKSNLISAIYSAITGDFKRHSLGKAGYIRNGLAQGEECFVEVTFELDGHEYTIRRYLSSNKATLKMDGLSISSKISEVNQTIDEVIGSSAYILDKHVFVRQTDFLSFITTASDRAKQLAQICRTEFMETLWTNLGIEINEVKDIIHNLDTELQALATKREMLLGLQKELAEKKAQYSEHLQLKPEEEEVNKANELLKLLEVQESLRKEAATLTSQSAQLALKMENIKQEIQQIDQDITDFDTKHGTPETLAEQIKALQETAKKLPEIVKKNATIRNLKDILARTFTHQKPVEPQSPLAEVTFANAQDYIDRYTEQKYTYENILKCRDAEVCPTCGTPVAQFSWKIEEAEKNLPALREKISAIGTFQVKYQHYLRELEKYNALHDEFCRMRQQAEKDLKALGEEIPEDEYRQAAQKSEALRRLLDKRLQLIETKRSKVSLLSAYKENLDSLNTRIESVQKQIINVSSDKVEAARKLIADHETWKKTDIALMAVINNLTNQITELNSQISRLEAENESAKIRTRYQSWLNLVTRAREIYHRNALPAIIHQQILRYLANLMNKSLMMMDAGFTITVDDELNIVANFGDNRQAISCHDLSGGQKVMVAIAYRLAIQEAFSRIDCLVLDEPTNFLDEYHLEKFSQLLDQLRDFCHKSRKQLCVITHERSIERCFDATLLLS